MSATDKDSPSRTSSPYLWSFTTYFTEGFPYSIIRTVSTVFFRDRGMSLEGIGLTSLFGLPWILKFLWGPHIDEYGTKRRWLLIMQGILVLVFFAASLLAGMENATTFIAFLFFAASFAAATHDTAIDGYYMEALDGIGQAKFLGYRVMAYRIAMMAGAGVVVTIGTTGGWNFAFLCSAMILSIFYSYHFFYLPHCEKKRKGFKARTLLRSAGILLVIAFAITVIAIISQKLMGNSPVSRLFPVNSILRKLDAGGIVGLFLLASLVALALLRKKIQIWLAENQNAFFSQAFFSFMDRDKIGFILAFVILIRTGEYMLSIMAAPFMVDLGIKVHYGWISGAIGLPCSIIGAMLGGSLIARYSLKKMSWPFLFAQNITNLFYMVLALSLSSFLEINTGNQNPVFIGGMKLAVVAGVHGFDQFAGGLGTAVLMTYLMRLCNPRYKAAHYAIGTGLMSVSGLYAGVISGSLAAWLGYGYFFGISFLLSIPGMLLLFFIPMLDSTEKKEQAA